MLAFREGDAAQGASDVHGRLISERRFELYDLGQDPEERVNVAARQPDVLETLKQELARWVEVDLQ